jgi:hypothetical protein
MGEEKMKHIEKQKTKVITNKVRLNFVNLFEPRAAAEGEEPRYSLSVLIPKSDFTTVSKIMEAVEEARKAGASLWGGKAPEALKTPLRDGDEERPEQLEYAGHYFLNASSKNKPGVVDKNLREILEASEVYSGCYGRVSLSFYPFSKALSKGIGCGLMNVQKLEGGEPLGRTTPEEDFADLEEEEDILS